MVKFDEVPVNAEMEPMSGFESPKYRRRYVPAEKKRRQKGHHTQTQRVRTWGTGLDRP
jgi:hypothetical protein